MTVDTTPRGQDAAVATGVVALRHVHKVFGGVHAVEDVSFSIRPGQVLALLGENGAGKSTCVKLLGGVYAADGGDVLIDGEPVVLHGPLAARAHGIAVVSQHPELFPDLSLAENVFAGTLPNSARGWIDHDAMRRRAADALGELGLERDVDAPVSGLSASEQQLVEIAKALVADARVLILDEPTASLSSREVSRLFGVVRRLTARGVAVVFVGHRLEEIFRIADAAVVLRDGRLVDERPISELTPDIAVSLMVGRDVDLSERRIPQPPGREMLKVEGLGRVGEFEDISLTVRAGEVVGLGGLVGAGRTELARCLFGVTQPDAGAMWIDGEPRRWRSVEDAIRHGVAYLSEDRRDQSLILDFSILDNAVLAVLDEVTVGGLVSRRRSAELVGPELAEMRLRYRSLDQAVGSLSGGNQQKVALAKWLSSGPRLLILDEPTQGIDVKTKYDVHQMIDRLARAGIAIIVISSDLPELLAVSDRIVVLREGRAVAELDRHEATEESVITVATRPTDADASSAHDGDDEEQDEAPARPIAGFAARWLARRELGLVAAIFAFAIPITVINANFLSGPIMRNLGRDVALLAIVALGQMLVMLTRNIDLSVSSVIGLTAYLSADVMRDHPGWPVVAAIFAGVLIGAACGLFNGLVVAVGQVPSIVVTLGTLAVYRGVTGWIAGTSQVSADQVPASWRRLGSASILRIPLFVYVALAVLVAVAAVLRSRRWGRELYAIGSNPPGARLVGIVVTRRVVEAFVASGALAGLAGALTASRYSTVDARVATGFELTVVAAVVVGGVALRGGSGTVLGVALGAVLLLVIQVGLPLARMNSLWLQGVYGLVILIAVVIDTSVDRARGRPRRPLTLPGIAPLDRGTA